MKCISIVSLAGVLLAGLAMPLQAEIFPLDANQDLIGEPGLLDAHHEDTLPDIARLHHLGFDEIVAANPGVDAWLPGEGTRVSLPTQRIIPDVPRAGIVVNLSEGRLYYFRTDAKGKRLLETFPVSVGQVGRTMPLGITKVVAKEKKPRWYPPKSIRDRHLEEGDVLPPFIPPGPDNPLGEYALRLAIPSGAFLIHGTNKPDTIGKRVSSGCIRLTNEDVVDLYERVKVGAKVIVLPATAARRPSQGVPPDAAFRLPKDSPNDI